MSDRDVVTRAGKGASLNISDHDQNINAFVSTSEEQTGATYEVVYTDQGKLIELNNASMVVTLDAIADIVAASDSGVDNFMVTLKNTNTATATINRSSTDTIDGETSITLTQNQTITLQTNAAGDGWLEKHRKHDIYSGKIDGADPVGSSTLPAGWSSLTTGTGDYRVTHNLSLATSDYAVLITVDTSTGTVISRVTSIGLNSFHYTTELANGTNVNSSASFIIMIP